MSERTRTEEQAQIQAEWMLQEETPIGFRNSTAWDLYRLKMWCKYQPVWFRITRNILGVLFIALLFAGISIWAGIMIADTVYPR